MRISSSSVMKRAGPLRISSLLSGGRPDSASARSRMRSSTPSRISDARYLGRRRATTASMRCDSRSIALLAAIARRRHWRGLQLVQPFLDPLQRGGFHARAQNAEAVADARAHLAVNAAVSHRANNLAERLGTLVERAEMAEPKRALRLCPRGAYAIFVWRYRTLIGIFAHFRTCFALITS